MCWLFNSPPSFWQWVGLFTGITALVVALMALPTVFQMIWGKPNVKVKLIVSLSQYKRATESCLVCNITNTPIKHRLLKMLGVYRRTADDVHALFNIKDAITHKIVASNVVAEISTAWDSVPMPSISLPASETSVIFTIVEVRTNGVATVKDSYGSQNFKLPKGEYYIITKIYVAEKVINCQGIFFIGTEPADLHLENKEAQPVIEPDAEKSAG